MAIVELKNVTKRFRKGDETITPLDDVSLDLAGGDFLSLMGPSGTGKSTLLNLVSGIDRPDSGTIVVNGTEITRLSRGKLADWRAENLGYIFQTHNLIPVLTAYENVELPTLLLKLTSAERQKRVELALEAVGLSDRAAEEMSMKLLDAVGLSEAAARYPSEISGGMQKRLGIARALSLAPNLILYDDPTAGLDPITSRKIIRLIKELQQRDRATVMLVTNELARAFQIADRMAFIFRGQLIVTGSVAETKTHSDLRVSNFLRGLPGDQVPAPERSQS